MDPVLLEWVNLALRWLHLIAGIAWIGSSFYFIHLDASLKQRAGLPQGVTGEAWQVHGGGAGQLGIGDAGAWSHSGRVVRDLGTLGRVDVRCDGIEHASSR